MVRNPTENDFCYFLKACDIFSKIFWMFGFIKSVWYIAFNTESEPVNIINLLLLSKVL